MVPVPNIPSLEAVAIRKNILGELEVSSSFTLTTGSISVWLKPALIPVAFRSA